MNAGRSYRVASVDRCKLATEPEEQRRSGEEGTTEHEQHPVLGTGRSAEPRLRTTGRHSRCLRHRPPPPPPPPPPPRPRPRPPPARRRRGGGGGGGGGPKRRERARSSRPA